MKLGRLGEALQSFDRALAIKPDSAGTHYNAPCSANKRLEEAAWL